MKTNNEMYELGLYLINVGATKVAPSNRYLDYNGEDEYIDFIYEENYYTFIKNDEVLSLITRKQVSKEQIEEVAALISLYIGKTPICYYKNNLNNEANTIISTIEWNPRRYNPRFNKISNPMWPFDTDKYTTDLVLYPDSEVYYKNRSGINTINETLFGKDWPKNFDLVINTCNEQDLFLIIDILNNKPISEGIGAWEDERTANVDMHYFYDKAVKATSRFVDFRIANDQNKAFLTWWSKWKDYFTLEKICEYIVAKEAGEDLTTFNPDVREKVKVKRYTDKQFYV